ncbi:MAG: DUF2283 domain-containing protein [bacterium]
MATTLNKDKTLQTWLDLSSNIVKSSVEHVWIDYDKEADVIYVSFRKPQRATHTEELEDDDILIRSDGDTIVGITIMNASTK